MTDIKEFAERYVNIWNEPDAGSISQRSLMVS